MDFRLTPGTKLHKGGFKDVQDPGDVSLKNKGKPTSNDQQI